MKEDKIPGTNHPERNPLENLVVIDRMIIGPVTIRDNKISSPYRIQIGKEEESMELVYSYEEQVFNPDDGSSPNLASMITAQVALNYGLFCHEITFDGVFDNTDKQFIRDMMENTSREIYVKKFLEPNPFLTQVTRNMDVVRLRKYTAAKIEFINTSYPDSGIHWDAWSVDRNRHAILSSGGKDSLLTYGILKELGKETHPVFINESGRHWFTALNAYRHFKKTEPNTTRVWSNCDRVYNWMLRHFPFIRKDFNTVRADDYPIRLWTLAVFIFGAIPIVRKRQAGRILIGNEYDCTRRTSFQGITHYDGLYDQSRYCDNALSRYYLKKGWRLSQFSILRSLSELLILKILVKRYPELQEHQVSCHASHESGGRIFPCGKCEKCRRIVGMLKALGEDPSRCGYTEEQIDQCIHALNSSKVKQIGTDAAHLYHMLLEHRIIDLNEYTKGLARAYPQILKLRYDHERSRIRDIPEDLRRPVISLLLNYADGAVKYTNRKWEEYDVLASEEMKTLYPFEMDAQPVENMKSNQHTDRSYLWAELTWPEISERLNEIDLAILPCGSIEQHGPHLPVDTDSFDAEYLAKRVAEACSHPKPLVLPPIYYGVSYHHEDFKGTVSVSNNALSHLVYDIGMNLARQGIKKLILVNGHGDNAPTLNHAAQMINRDAGIFVAVDTGETSDEDVLQLTQTKNDIHAGEIETSTSLATRPHLVKMDRARDMTLKFGSSYLDFSSNRRIPWYVRTKKITENGVMGNPMKASEEKGKKIWEIMVAHLVTLIEELKNTPLEDLYQKKY